MPHTDGSVVFARLRECASHHLHPNRHLHCTGSAPEHVRSSSGPAPFRLKILPLHVWESGPTSGSMGLESTSQTASRSVQPFLHSSPDTVPIPYNGLALFSLKIAPCIGASGPPFKHGSLGPAPSQYLEQHHDRSSHYRDHGRDRQTDRPRCSVCSNRPHLASADIWPNDTLFRNVFLTDY